MTNLILVQGAEILIDDEDYASVSDYNWRVNNSGHVLTTIDSKTVMLHRFVLGITDSNIIIDHRDRNKLNCQKYNLKQTDIIGNSRNRTPTGKSGHIGIEITQYGKYRARIKINGRNISLGNYDDVNSAIIARKNAELKYWRKIDNE